MKTNRILLIFFLAFAASCSKDEFNERKMAGIWEGKKVQYLFYQNNEQVKDSTVANSGALYLWDEDELGNQWKTSLAITPNFTWDLAMDQTWEGNATRKEKILMGVTIRKLTRRKMELIESATDTALNVTSSTIYYFER